MHFLKFLNTSVFEIFIPKAEEQLMIKGFIKREKENKKDMKTERDTDRFRVP